MEKYNLNFNSIFNDLKSYDFDDLQEIRKAIARYGLVLNNVVKEYEKILDIMHDIIKYSEKKRNDKKYLRCGVYQVLKGKKIYTYYHLVSDLDYFFPNVINSNWVLKNTFEIDSPRDIRINRIIVDFDYWVSNNL